MTSHFLRHVIQLSRIQPSHSLVVNWFPTPASIVYHVHVSETVDFDLRDWQRVRYALHHAGYVLTETSMYPLSLYLHTKQHTAPTLYNVGLFPPMEPLGWVKKHGVIIISRQGFVRTGVIILNIIMSPTNSVQCPPKRLGSHKATPSHRLTEAIRFVSG